MSNANKPNPELKIVKPGSFSEKFKSKNAPIISGVDALLQALPIYKIGDTGDFLRTHFDEENYWTCEMAFVDVPIQGSKRDMLHVIDDDLAVKYLPSKKIKRHRLALASKPYDKYFFCIVPSRNLDNDWNKQAMKGCYEAQSRWVQVTSRKAEGVEGYEIKPAMDVDAFPETKWPIRHLDDLLEVTFREANIDHDRHPALLRLIGAKQDLT